jgi:lipopolysaccharide/colanic/teichoic acid biosynthesis glycosyltransferase
MNTADDQSSELSRRNGLAAASVQNGWPALLKASLDRAAATCGLVLVLPLLAAIALAIRLEGHGPAFFVQTRPGLGGRPFRLVKFRTMRAALGPDGRPLPDGERLTRLGRWLRRASLDELPQLWNVARGQLSLVGPRPLLMEYLPLYSPEQARRHLVKQGITGWAQINGRNAISWEEKFALDCWYVDHWSLLLDFTILLKTVQSVLTRHGVSAPGQATAEKFEGSIASGDRHA